MNAAIRNLALIGALAGSLTLAATGPATAQDDGGPPPGWMVRTDGGGHGAAEGLEFTEMPPGFHIMTGPAGIFYHPAQRADGAYRVEAEIFLFDPGNRREGFGLLFAGTELDGDGQAYTYFLIRRDGKYLIKRRDGSETATIQEWTDHSAITTWENRGEDQATLKYVLAVQVGASAIAFYVNDSEVARIPRDGLSTDGVAGLRINHGLNLHVTRLDVTTDG